MGLPVPNKQHTTDLCNMSAKYSQVLMEIKPGREPILLNADVQNRDYRQGRGRGLRAPRRRGNGALALPINGCRG